MTQDPAHKALEITDKTFEATIKSEKPVLIDFWASWCGPCRIIMPIIEELAQEAMDQFVIGKLDIDQNSETTTKYGVRSIPTLIIFKNCLLYTSPSPRD